MDYNRRSLTARCSSGKLWNTSIYEEKECTKTHAQATSRTVNTLKNMKKAAAQKQEASNDTVKIEK